VHFVFTRLFYILITVALVPLSLSWQQPWLRWVAFGYDALLIILAIVDAQISKLPASLSVTREFNNRFAVGAETEVRIQIQNASNRAVDIIVKDEFPPQMKLHGLREGK
jgi:uncharacterized protein (DUF58 family)